MCQSANCFVIFTRAYSTYLELPAFYNINNKKEGYGLGLKQYSYHHPTPPTLLKKRFKQVNPVSVTRTINFEHIIIV